MSEVWRAAAELMKDDDLKNAIVRASAALLAIQRDPRNRNLDGNSDRVVAHRRMLEVVQLDILSTVPREHWHELVDERGHRLLNIEAPRKDKDP